MDPEDAVQDFMKRRENYMSHYEPVTEKDGPFCRIINSKQFIVSNIRGYLPLKVRTKDNGMPRSSCSMESVVC